MPVRWLPRLARTLAGNLYLVLGSIVFATAAILLAWVPPRGSLVFRCARAWARGLLWASGVQLEVEREEAIDPRRPLVFVANHQSLFDIPVLLVSLPGQTRFLAKQSLFRIPVFGWALHAGGFVPVDRKNRGQAREAFAAAVSRLAAGTSILLFPEETRSRDGRLLPFQRGGFLLAKKSGLAVVPVGVRGTLEVQPRGSLWIDPRRVVVRYGRPVDLSTTELRRKGEAIESVRREVARLAGASLA